MISENQISRSISSVARRTFGLWLLLLIFILSICTYWYSYNTLRSKTISELESYLRERVEREAYFFSLAEKNIETFSIALEKNLLRDEKNIEQDFSKRFEILPNGVLRNKDYQNPFDTQAYAPAGMTLTPFVKQVLLRGHENLATFGYAWSTAFMNIWLAGKEGYALSFTPAIPHSLHFLSADYSFKDFESVSIGLPENNPTGTPRWTGPFFDKTLQDWIIAYNLPFSFKGEFLLSLGIDFRLSDIDKRMASNTINGAYAILFDAQGRLISHPRYAQEIRNNNGKFYVSKSEDKILRFVTTLKEGTGKRIRYLSDESMFVGVQQFGRSGWYLAIVYPESNLADYSKKLAIFVALIGIFSLLLQLMIMNEVIRRNVSAPIWKLISGVRKITAGDFAAQVDVKSSTEMGLLSTSFNEMARQLDQQKKNIDSYQQGLETLIEKRTKELDVQRAQVFHASRLANLGEMAGRVAHEINNPLSTLLMGVDIIRKQAVKEVPTNSVIFSTLEKMHTNSIRISEIVNAMRVLSDTHPEFEFKAEPLAKLMQKTLLLFEETLAKNHIQMNVSPPPNVEVECNVVTVSRILFSLIQNSVDALKDSAVRIIDIHFEEIESGIKLSIEDTGARIPDEIAERIFDPFFTTKGVGEGIGLSLFMSLNMAKANRGKLYYDKQSARTRFVLELPVKPSNV